MSSDLTSVERDVITALAQSRVTASAVTVAAELWRGDGTDAGDPVGMVTFVLEGLNDRGLVRYNLTAKEYAGPNRPWTQVPMQVALTPEGWAAAGYPTTHGHVGHGSRHARDNVKHTADMTDYRNHHDVARGVGPIEKEDFATHRDLFPQHIHMYGNTDEGDINMPRGYTPVTPELEAAVLDARTALGPTAYEEIAASAGVSVRTAKYILTDLPRLRRLADPEEVSTGSLKERIVATLMAVPVVANSAELVRILGRGDSDHDVVHVLHSLHTQGKVDFKEGRDKDNPTNIRLTDRGRGLATKKAEAKNGTEQTTDDVLRDAIDRDVFTHHIDVQPGDVTVEAYPLLDALLEREKQRLDADNKGMAYVTAAEAIEAIDPEAARDLMAKAEALNVVMPSPIEREYLDYVSRHSQRDPIDV